jgi:hypothetical protein
MYTLGLNFSTLRLPEKPAFPEQVKILIQACIEVRQLRNKESLRAQEMRHLHCHTLIEGLYQTWCCMSPKARLNVFLSPQFYHATKDEKINHLSFHYVEETVYALESLGWAEVVKGCKLTKTDNLPTQLTASGGLLRVFEKASLLWSPLKPPKETIVLRGYDSTYKERFPVKVRQTSSVRKMAANVRKINEHLRQQAICLHLNNDNLKRLRVRMAEGNYRSKWHQFKPEKHGRLLNFNHVYLRRIFSQESMERGGRFYGGWWQFIPSKSRPFVTINGHATVEVDFSELHPRLLYLGQQLEPPTGDLYDIGLRHEGTPYDPKVEPYASQRKIIKEVFNALLNDETGRYRLSTSKIKQMGGLTFGQLKKLLLKRHPPLQNVLRKGVGLSFQYQDSQIAEKVMLKLLEQNITCLPVHDSFIVARHFGNELIAAMREAFSSLLPGYSAKLKEPTDFDTDFRLIFKGDRVDMPAMFAMFAEAHHERFVNSRPNETRR